jgi:phage tail tape-measure protein
MSDFSELDAKVAALKKRIADMAKERVRAEQQHAVAADRAQQAEKALAAEFDVRPEEVPALAEKLQADLDAEVRRVQVLLDKAEEKA